MYQINFYVPETHLEQVKNALFAQGAGRIGNYSHCAWQTKGQGQYCPLAGSKPFSGEQDKIMHETEYKVEMVCTRIGTGKRFTSVTLHLIVANSKMILEKKKEDIQISVIDKEGI